MTAPVACPLLLPGFEYRRMDVAGMTVSYAIRGSGPPLLLLHGYPENHLLWRHVAPVLARDHTVVLADLRGYGDSGKPVPDAAGNLYSKRFMARDQVGLMRQLGVHSRDAVNWRQAVAGSGGSQAFPAMASRMASSAVMPWAAAESR
jgi:haloacetate dehalogenase